MTINDDLVEIGARAQYEREPIDDLPWARLSTGTRDRLKDNFRAGMEALLGDTRVIVEQSETRAQAFAEVMRAIDARRCYEAGLFDEAHSGSKGESRLNALYDAYHLVRKLALPHTPRPVEPGCMPAKIEADKNASDAG